MNSIFLKRSIDQSIKASKQKYTFYRNEKSQYGGETDNASVVAELEGMYHSTANYISINVSDSSSVGFKQQPKILCRYEDVQDLIQQNDTVYIGGVKHKVNNVEDIQNLHVGVDISVEKVLT